jgi:hypothetical protein
MTQRLLPWQPEMAFRSPLPAERSRSNLITKTFVTYMQLLGCVLTSAWIICNLEVAYGREPN